MNELTAGIAREQEFTVSHANTAAAVFATAEASEVTGMPAVWSTPDMISKMELVSAALVAGLLPSHQMTVGSHHDIAHLAPTPEGAHVRVRALLSAIEGRKLTFEVEAFDPHERVGAGTHVRFVVDREKFNARLVQKQKA